MVIKKLLCAALLLAGLMSSAEVSAQTRWKGNNVSDCAGKEIFLYNVGTGKFLIAGGDWATQARLFYDGWGTKLTLKTLSSGYGIYTGINGDDKILGANVPRISSFHTYDSRSDVWQPIMDAAVRYQYWANVSGGTNYPYGNRYTTFERIEGETGDTYTYYIADNMTGGNGSTTLKSKYYIGAAYGIEFDDNGDEVHEQDLGNDECAYENEDHAKSTTKHNVNSSDVTMQELYQWRIVTFDEVKEEIKENTTGLNSNISYEVADQDFSRNVTAFYSQWKVATTSAYDNLEGKSGYRFKYTWGSVSSPGDRERHQDGVKDPGEYPDRYSSTTLDNNNYWCYPVLLKHQFGDTWKWALYKYDKSVTTEGEYDNLSAEIKADCAYEAMKDSKYGFMSFSGIGVAYSSIKAPATGFYQIQCVGFCQSANASNKGGYLYANVGSYNPPSTNSTTGAREYLKQDNSDLDYRTTYMQVMEAGKLVTLQQDAYTKTVLIYATEGQTIYFGVGKDDASKSEPEDYKESSRYYYHDKDWIAADNFQIFFLGEDPVLFDEDKGGDGEKWSYLGDNKTFSNQTMRLKRTFKKDQWNTFVFPLSLTGAQVKGAFGDKTELAKLVELGKYKNNADYIEFETVNLPADDQSAAIEPHVFYLIKPKADPVSYTPSGSTEAISCYNLGRGSFSTNNLPTEQAVSTVYGVYSGVTQGDLNNKIKSYATYFNGTEIPAKSYVMGAKNGSDILTMYHLTSSMTSKGFRGWIEDVTSGGAKTYGGIFNYQEDEVTGINVMPWENAPQNGVYDMSGRKVAESINPSLKKGLYIVNGKKFIIK